MQFKPGQAVIIGGSGGIGAAICRAFAEAGSDVALTYRGNQDAAEATAESVRGCDVGCTVHQVDATDRAGVDDMFAAARKTGPIHSVVIAAGASIPMAWISKLEPEQWQDVMANDTNGAFNVMQTAIPHLRESEGAIVHVSSAGLRRYPTRDILSVAPKAAIHELIRGVAREEGRHGVRANSVGVGVVEAGMFLRLKSSYFDEQWIAAAKANAALQRFGSAEEVADVVAFLASERAGYVTGQYLAVDGGYSI